MNPEQISNIRADAENNFTFGYLYAESVLLALANAQGIEDKLFLSFCDRMARICSALTGKAAALTARILAECGNQSR